MSKHQCSPKENLFLPAQAGKKRVLQSVKILFSCEIFQEWLCFPDQSCSCSSSYSSSNGVARPAALSWTRYCSGSKPMSSLVSIARREPTFLCRLAFESNAVAGKLTALFWLKQFPLPHSRTSTTTIWSSQKDHSVVSRFRNSSISATAFLICGWARF